MECKIPDCLVMMLSMFDCCVPHGTTTKEVFVTKTQLSAAAVVRQTLCKTLLLCFGGSFGSRATRGRTT